MNAKNVLEAVSKDFIDKMIAILQNRKTLIVQKVPENSNEILGLVSKRDGACLFSSKEWPFIRALL